MVSRAQINVYKKKYEEQHHVTLTDAEAEYRVFLLTGRRSLLFFGIAGLVTLAMEIWLIFFEERFAYYPAAWALVGLLVLFNLRQVCSRLKEIREYPEKHTSSPGVKPLTREVILQKHRNDAFDARWTAGLIVFACICAAAAVLFFGSWLAKTAACLGAFAVIGLIIQVMERKENARVQNGDFLLASSILKSIRSRDVGDSYVSYFTFGDTLPAGDDAGTLLNPGEYREWAGTPACMPIGTRFYLVLLRSEKQAKKGIECYTVCDAYPADEWEPDDELRQSMLEG